MITNISQTFVAAICKAYQTAFRFLYSFGTKRCESNRPIHRVLMYFSKLGGYWYCVFFDDQRLNVRLPRRVTFRDKSKIYQLATRGNAELGSADAREELDRAIKLGRGKIWLRLSDEQRATLEKEVAA